MKQFFDTNVLLYQYDGAHPAKRARARERVVEAIRDQQFVISTQVMMEFYINVTKKFADAIVPADAQLLLQSWAGGGLVIALTPEMIVDAATLQERHGVSWWDANIVVAAQRAEAEVLVTEDMQHGRHFDALRVENPFLSGVNERKPTPYKPKRKT
ncbi:MAG TPA: PIN domain-containing protein [Rudaea sp.]|nr:PIN domain-containing protein [Rudaea sp.]